MSAPRRLAAVVSVGMATTLGAASMATAAFTPRADPFTFDPGSSGIVKSKWKAGAGLKDSPGSVLRIDLPGPGVEVGVGLVASSQKRFGLVLEKNGPTTTNAAAGAEIRGVKGIRISELGFDIKSDTHCGGGAPRFNVEARNGDFFFVGNCSLATRTDLGNGWTRVRMTPANVFPLEGPAPATLAGMGTVRSVAIVLDEGADMPVAPPLVMTPGRTVIDNIDVNGRLITRPGPAR
jgi:hypothetical protein